MRLDTLKGRSGVKCHIWTPIIVSSQSNSMFSCNQSLVGEKFILIIILIYRFVFPYEHNNIPFFCISTIVSSRGCVGQHLLVFCSSDVIATHEI
jgi:hypothetical protein